VDNFSGKGSSERTDTLPAGFVRFEHTLAEMPYAVCRAWYTERFPDYWELFSPTYGPDGTSDAFDKVKTEKTTQLDIGAQYSGKRTNAWVSAYVGHVNDFILFRYDPNDAYISQVDNINATIMGGEADVDYKLTDSWKTDASLAYSWGRNMEDGKPLPQMPPLEARLGLSGKVVTGAVPGWYVWSVASIGWRLMKVMWWAKILQQRRFCRGFRQCRLPREQVL
jgi:iron complex outermembrane receptor protein